jgi:hypothetical protein
MLAGARSNAERSDYLEAFGRLLDRSYIVGADKVIRARTEGTGPEMV